jgi:hypothetical protein
MIGQGWANSCGKELFTIGWIPCAVVESTTTPGATGRRKSQLKRRHELAMREDDELIAIIESYINFK